ncbi:unnamed protein product [Cladocopium goreaui]|uniref:UBA domain-containing protein n=1 Tax=Cladocopium goreaui TaxID=2562237 RepID=A0A9P1GS44_9DINO|nr:unnamed protein product [Cladocopium goreaui]
MLMRNSTRIEFRLEDAQEYIRTREAQKRPVGQTGHTCTLPPVPGASPATDDAAAFPTPQSSTTMSPIDRAASLDAGEVNEAQQSRTESLTFVWSPNEEAPPQREMSESVSDRFQAEVEQLAVLGIDEEDARRALRATGGDLEAAADRLLL